MRDGAVGFTRTPAGVERIGEEIYDRAGALTPQRRASVPEDVAALALWLGSPANASVTGEVIREGTSAARTPLVALSSSGPTGLVRAAAVTADPASAARAWSAVTVIGATECARPPARRVPHAPTARWRGAPGARRRTTG
jgi:hypothetical protein